MAVAEQGSVALKKVAALFAVGAFYIVLRILAWLNTPELEGHDSVSYLIAAEMFRSDGLRAAANMTPDMTPLFPLLTGWIGVFTDDIEFAARLVSFLSSVATMTAVYLLARRLSGFRAGLIAVLLLSLTSFYVRMSYAVMTEPLYVALTCWIVVVFVASLAEPKLRHGILLGLLCGLAFLTRVEAILLPFVLPILHLLACRVRSKNPPYRLIAANYALLSVFMAVVAAPQVIRVSAAVGEFSLNSRFVRAEIRAYPGDSLHNERLFGLKYDPKIRNLEYLQLHPELRKEQKGKVDPGSNLRRHLSISKANIIVLHDEQIAKLIGLPVFAFCVVGFIALLRSKKHPEAVWTAGFVAIFLVAPVYHLISLRHLLIVIPVCCVLASTGLVFSSQVVSQSFRNRYLSEPTVAVLLLLPTLAIPALETRKILLEPDNHNHEYTIEALLEPVSIIREYAQVAGKQPKLMSRKNYLAYLSGLKPDGFPYTDLEGLLTYLDGRGVDYLFIEEKFVADYPFFSEIGSDTWRENFREIYTYDEQPDDRLALYSVITPRR